MDRTFVRFFENGLLGYRDAGRDHFYGLEQIQRFRLPAGASEYVFHPGLKEAAGLAPARPLYD